MKCFKDGNHSLLIHKYEHESCRIQDTNIYIIIGLALIVVFFISGMIFYKYRTEIQILIFVRFGLRILSKKNQLDEEDKESRLLERDL